MQERKAAFQETSEALHNKLCFNLDYNKMDLLVPLFPEISLYLGLSILKNGLKKINSRLVS